MQLRILSIQGDAPIQAFGLVNRHAFYFRARGDCWLFAVASAPNTTMQSAVLASVGKGSGLVIRRRCPDTSEITQDQVVAIIKKCAAAFAAFRAQ